MSGCACWPWLATHCLIYSREHLHSTHILGGSAPLLFKLSGTMSRIASISSAAGPSKAGSPESLSLNAPHSNGSPWPMGRTVSGMSVVDKALDTAKPGDLDPDELLTTYSVSDVKKVQQRLRCVVRSSPSTAQDTWIPCIQDECRGQARRTPSYGWVRRELYLAVHSSSMP